MRLFLATPVPLNFAAATEPFLGLNFRPVPMGSWHMTLRFLGDVDAESVVDALADFDGAAIESKCTRAGAFPDASRARVAWIGMDGGPLQNVAEMVRKRVAHLGEKDGKDFVAHVTLGRFREPTDARVALSQVVVPTEPVHLNRVELMGSELTPSGPRYTVLHSWGLD